jgi:hypothetical protein
MLGNLVPANINLWLGHSVGGTSSGLHHDYHDNLHVCQFNLAGKRIPTMYKANPDRKPLHTSNPCTPRGRGCIPGKLMRHAE